MKIKKLLAYSSLLLLTLMFSNFAMADFGVRSTPTPCEEGAKLEYYGNAHTPKFRTAIRGDEEIPIEEQMEVEELLPSIEYDTAYVRTRFHFSKRRVSKIKNESSTTPSNYTAAGGALDFTAASVAQSSVEAQIKGIDFALGYIWPDSRAEIEYLFLKKIDYNSNPILTGIGAIPAGFNTGFSSEIKTDAILANMYYEFLKHDRLRPYAFFGFGLAMNKASTAYNGNNRSVQKLGIAWQFGLGAKFRIIDRLYLDGAFRYAQLGKTLMFNDNSLKLNGKSTLTGVGLGLLFLI